MPAAIKRNIKALCHRCGLDVRWVPPYRPYEWLNQWNIRTVLDIGANTGQFAAMIHKALPEARIYSFEPLRDCYEQLRKNMVGILGFKAFNFALGDIAGQAEIHRNDATPSSSLLPMAELHKTAFPFTAHSEPELIEIRRLDDVVHELEIADNLLIKIDVQGAEDKVIRGGLGTLSRASALVVETSFEELYEGQPLFHTIYEMLRGNGLTYMGSEQNIRNPTDGRVLQCDSVFIRRTVEDEKIHER